MAFSLAVQKLLTMCLKTVGVGTDTAPTGGQMDDAYFMLNTVVNSLQGQIDLPWKYSEGTLTLTASSQRKNGGRSFECILGHTSVAGNEPGVGADWTTYWVELSYDSTMTAWALSTAYTASHQLTLPATTLAVDKVWIRRTNMDYPCIIRNYAEYASIGMKSLSGLSSEVFFMDYGTLANGIAASQLFLYPRPSVTTDVVHYRAILNVIESTDSTIALDFLKVFYEPLFFMISYHLSMIYKVAIETQDRLSKENQRAINFFKDYKKKGVNPSGLSGQFVW